MSKKKELYNYYSGILMKALKMYAFNLSVMLTD